MIFLIVLSYLEVEVLFSWLWAKRDFAGIKSLDGIITCREGPSLAGIE